MKRGNRSVVLMFALLLLGGALVNVAVAWGLAVCIDLTEAPRSVGIAGDGTSKWQGMSHKRTGGYLFTSTWWPNQLPPYTIQQPLAGIVPEWAPAGHTSPWNAADAGSNKAHNDLIEARGWPRLALLSWIESHDASHTTKAGIDLKFWTRKNNAGRTTYRLLPTRPIWPGFAINTLFYAAILWLLFAAPFALRRHRRIKRGQCAKCGYDLRGSPARADSPLCPECGATVPSPLRGRARVGVGRSTTADAID
jgi:hypothetical protein